MRLQRHLPTDLPTRFNIVVYVVQRSADEHAPTCLCSVLDYLLFFSLFSHSYTTFAECIDNNNSVALVLERTMPTFADRGCRDDPHGRILGFVERSRYFFSQVTPQLCSRG
jgi:hypothetical protein